MSDYISVETLDGPNRQYWATRPYVSDDLRPLIEKADILILPREGFRDQNNPLFTIGTSPLFGYLRKNLPSDVTVEIPVDDDLYEELTLHSAVIIVGAFLVSAVVAPVAVNLISEAVKNRFPQYFGGKTPATAQLELTMMQPDGSQTRIKYDGPAELMRPQLEAAIKAVQQQNPPTSNSLRAWQQTNRSTRPQSVTA